MGSAKDVWIIEPPTKEKTGYGVFRFLDDFSVFDYGKMPGGIPGKGNALWLMSTYNFEMLGEKLPTHYLGRLEPNLMAFRVANISTCKASAETGLGFVYKRPAAGNFVVPLEVIYRNELGPESSIMRLYKNGEIKPEDIGLEEISECGVLPHPILTYSTKFEETDIFVKKGEAALVAGLNDEEFYGIEDLALKVNAFINEQTANVARKYDINLIHPDGKCEILMINQKAVIGDVFGTLDEDRFEIILEDGTNMKLSKQILRNWYKKTDWYNVFEEWKKNPKGEKPKPPKAPRELVDYVSSAYQTFARMWTLQASQSEFKNLEEKFRELKETSVI